MHTPYFQRRLHSEVQGKHLFARSVSVSEYQQREDRDSVCLIKYGPRRPALLITEHSWGCLQGMERHGATRRATLEGGEPSRRTWRDRIERNTSEEIKKEEGPKYPSIVCLEALLAELETA